MLQNDCLVTTCLFDEGSLDTRDETVGHLPREFSRIAWYFLARSGEISVEVIGCRRHYKQLYLPHTYHAKRDEQEKPGCKYVNPCMQAPATPHTDPWGETAGQHCFMFNLR